VIATTPHSFSVLPQGSFGHRLQSIGGSASAAVFNPVTTPARFNSFAFARSLFFWLGDFNSRFGVMLLESAICSWARLSRRFLRKSDGFLGVVTLILS
jgi:hypothetical protein